MLVTPPSIKTACLAALALAIASCGKPATAPAEDREPAAAETPTGAPTNSIFDPEAGVEPSEAELEPLVQVISFAKSGSELGKPMQDKLAAMLASDQGKAGGRIVIRGHSDAGGSDQVNLRVSLERAEAVRDYLVGQGADEKRIRVIAFGSQNPVEPNALPDGSPNEAGRAANRRVEVTIELPAPASTGPASTGPASPGAATPVPGEEPG
ncbi:MAG: OmpA family protein [Altererythrobacter sp.]|nr:OmpA family protein [Altererythrobacter sp.]